MRYLLPLFAVTLSYNPSIHPRDYFYQAIAGAAIQYYVVERLLHGKGALIASTLLYPLAIFFPGSFFFSYGFILSQAYNTGILVSDKYSMGIYAFRVEMLGFIIAHCVVIPIYIQMAMAAGVFALALDTVDLAILTEDPQKAMENLIIGLDPRLPGESLGGEALLSDETSETTYATFKNRQTLRHYKLLCSEYRAFITDRYFADSLQFGLFYLMFLLSENLLLFVFSLLNPIRWRWTVLVTCGAVLMGLPWTWTALLADFAVGPHVPSRLLTGYLAYLIVDFSRLNDTSTRVAASSL